MKVYRCLYFIEIPEPKSCKPSLGMDQRWHVGGIPGWFDSIISQPRQVTGSVTAFGLTKYVFVLFILPKTDLFREVGESCEKFADQYLGFALKHYPQRVK